MPNKGNFHTLVTPSCVHCTDIDRKKMERWRDGAVRSPQFLPCQDYPSFSSTLLEAIYRSMEEADKLSPTKEHFTGGGPDSFFSVKKQIDAGIKPPSKSVRENSTKQNPNFAAKSLIAENRVTSSSSDRSSCGGFSSSEEESFSASIHSIRLSRNPPVSGSQEKRAKESNCSMRKRRIPLSPGSRIAKFLHSLFATKSKFPQNAMAENEESACSSASSYSRSCLSKNSSSKKQPSSEKRTVRFCPVDVNQDKDFHAYSHKCLYGRDQRRYAERAPEKSVLEKLRTYSLEEEEEDDSDASSDLFELENLDELPVYETTSFDSRIAISHNLLL